MTNSMRAAAVAILASLAFVGSNALVKAMGSGGIPSPEIGLFRSAGGLIFLALAWRSIWPPSRLPDRWGHLARGVLGALTILCLMHAFVTLPFAVVVTLYYARVLVMIPLAWVWLGERARPGVWGAAIVGLMGVAVALAPSAALPDRLTGVLAVVAAAFLSAGSQVMVTRLTRTNRPETIVGVFAVVATAILAVPAASVWVPPTTADWNMLFGVALLGGAALWLVAHAYGMGGAGFVAPFSYLEIPMAAVIGYLMDGELASSWEVVGGVIVIGATAHLMWRSSRI